MPQPEAAARLQSAVVWAKTGTAADGTATVAPPAQIAVRWEWVRRERPGPDNTVVTTEADVFAPCRVRVGSILWQGRLRDLPAGTASPAAEDSELYRVMSCDVIPDVRNRGTEFELRLARHTDSLPPRTA